MPTATQGPCLELARVGRFRQTVHYLVLIPIGLFSLLFSDGPQVPANNVWWSRTLVQNTPQQIWASSHFGQVLDYLILQAVRHVRPGFTASGAMSYASYLNGAVYIAALVVLGIGLGRSAQSRLLIVGLVSPLTVFLRGDEQIGAYPFPLLILVAGLALMWRDRVRAHHVALELLAGTAAALHGSGLLFLPGILAIRFAAERSIRRPAVAVMFRLTESAVTFFGPTGVLLIAYVLVFRHTTIVAGDATGGSWGTLWLPPFGTLHATLPEFQDYAFWSGQHATDVATMLVFGAPAFLFLVGRLGVARLFGQEDALGLATRDEWPVWTLAFMGLGITIWMYPAGGIMFQAFILVPALSLLHTLSLRALIRGDARGAWLWPFLPIVVVSGAATAALWYRLATL